MQSSPRCLSPGILGLAALVVALAGCGPASSGSPSTAQSHDDQLAGHYTGTGAYVTAISFDVAADGSSMSHFHGFITASCYTGGSLYSGANQTQYNQYTIDDPGRVDIDGNNDFSSTYTVADNKASFTYKGSLDGNGGATGTVSYKNGACASITAPWSASLKGVSPPPIPGVTPSGQADSCQPQPCGTIAPLVLTIDGFHTATWTGHGDAPMLELDFTLTSTSPDSVTGFADHLWLNDSSHGPAGPGSGINSLTLSSGAVVQCDHGATLQPGQKLSLHFCYAQGDLDTSQSIRLDWISVRGSTVHLDLGTPD